MGRLVAGLGILAFLVARGKSHTVAAAFDRVPFWVLPAAVAFYLAGQLLSVLKWQMLLRAAGAEVPFKDLTRFYLMGMFWNLWMPTNIGGDAVRVWSVRPYCPRLAVAASSVAVERLTGFFALLIFACGGLLGSALTASAQTTAWGVVLGAFVILCGLGVVLVILSRGGNTPASATSAPATPWQGLVRKIGAKVASFSQAILFYAGRQQRKTLAWSMFLSLVFQASQILLNIGLAHAAGLDLPALTFWWLVPVLVLASLLPLGIGGLGVREAAATALLGYTAAAGTIIAWSLLWQATVWLSSLPGAWPVLTGKARPDEAVSGPHRS